MPVRWNDTQLMVKGRHKTTEEGALVPSSNQKKCLGRAGQRVGDQPRE